MNTGKNISYPFTRVLIVIFDEVCTNECHENLKFLDINIAMQSISFSCKQDAQVLSRFSTNHKIN